MHEDQYERPATALPYGTAAPPSRHPARRVTSGEVVAAAVGLVLYSALAVGACAFVVGFARRRQRGSEAVSLFVAGFLILRSLAVAHELWILCRNANREPTLPSRGHKWEKPP
jgi:hypothetical protein